MADKFPFEDIIRNDSEVMRISKAQLWNVAIKAAGDVVSALIKQPDQPGCWTEEQAIQATKNIRNAMLEE